MNYQRSYERLVAAIREGEPLDVLTRMVGPSEEENEAARVRIERMNWLDDHFDVSGSNHDPEHYSAFEEYMELSDTQDAFERRYC